MRTKIFYKQLSRKPSKYEKIEELENVFMLGYILHRFF
jgi:hypothetical protein